jgi:putative ABC transport system substrate-binding protein
VPTISRIAVLVNPASPPQYGMPMACEAEAQALRVSLQRAEALMSWDDAMSNGHRHRLLELALMYRPPTMCGGRQYAEAGCLVSYSPVHAELFRRAATSVDKIVKGAKPADLPVAQPTKFALVINLKTAKALGLTIPPAILFQADEVIR